MSSAGAAPRAAVPVSNARAEASRRNGAMSRGPKTTEGKARAAQNALKHGLRAEKYVVLPDEDAAGFAALEAALTEELAPDGALQNILVGRIARRLAARAGGAARGRAVRGASHSGRQPRPRADPRRQWHPVVRDPAPLSRRRAGRAHALAAHPQSASGRSGCRHRGAGRLGATCPGEPGRISDPKEPEARPNSTRPEPDQWLPEPGALRNPSDPEAKSSRPTRHPSVRPRSWGSKTSSSLMPSGSAKKTA
jgi:hypothetical protein